MKTILLSTLFSLFVCATQACSCFYISDYFCPSASWVNSNSSTALHIVQVKVLRHYGYYMDVEIADNLQNTIPENEITILGQDGLNCNEYLNPFTEGDFFILAIYPSNWEEGVYDLSGCGRFWLPVNEGKVQGNINENVQEQNYAVFKQGLAQCAGITPAEEPGLASLLLYPNPTSGELFLDGLNPAARLKYTIYSYSGQRLRSGLVEGGSSPSLSLSGLPSGLYLIRIQAGDGQVVLSRRILLERE